MHAGQVSTQADSSRREPTLMILLLLPPVIFAARTALRKRTPVHYHIAHGNPSRLNGKPINTVVRDWFSTAQLTCPKEPKDAVNKQPIMKLKF